MNFRVTDNTVNARLTNQINNARQKIAVTQEQLASGKKINRPSDNPYGAAVVLDLRNSQNAIEQFTSIAKTINSNLSITDTVLDSYQKLLDRANTLLTQGRSDSTSAEGRKVLATEIRGISEDILKIANTRNGEKYIFGGTQQNQPPFDPTTATPSTISTFAQQVQLEPNSNAVTVDILASNIFNNGANTIFNTLTAVNAALEGTGNDVADKATLSNALSELNGFTQQANTNRTIVGKTLNTVENVLDRLSQTQLSLESSAQDTEAIDFGKVATQLVESNRQLEAILSSSSQIGRRSLLDFLG